MERTVRYPDRHQNHPAGATDLLARHRPTLGQQQQDQHERRATEDIQNITGRADQLVALAAGRKANQMPQDQHQTDELQHQAEREQLGNGVLLDAHRVQLQRHQQHVHAKEHQIHLEYVLLVERELQRQRTGARPIGPALHQVQIVVDGRRRWRRAAARLSCGAAVRHTPDVRVDGGVVVLPTARGLVAIAGDQ